MYAVIPSSGYGCIGVGRPGQKDRLGFTNGVQEITLEPVAAVRYPPTGIEDRDRGSQGPPERQNEICQQAEQGKYDPENLLFHPVILDRLRGSRGDEREMSLCFSFLWQTYTKVR